MNISGFSSSSELLNDIFASTSSTSKSSTSSSGASASGDTTSFSDSMTISQIRDNVDKMALSGKLTDAQQRALIGAGYQDMNAADPSYQPAAQTGPSRSDTQPVDVMSTLESMGSFAANHGNSEMAATYKGLANMFTQDDQFRN